MNSGIKKRVCILSAALIISLSMSTAATFDNNIVDIQFTESGNQVTAVILTEKGYSAPIKATKAGGYYNIILPNIGKGTKSSYASNVSSVDLVRVTTLPSSTGGGSYTKIAIKTKPGATVTATSQIYEEIESDIEREKPTRPVVEQPLYQEPTTDEVQHLEDEYIEDSEYTEEETEEPIEIQDNKVQATQPPPIQEVPDPVTAPQQTLPVTPQNHTSEILYILIGTAAVLLVVVLLYIKGKDKMHELCGDMSISLDDDKNDKKKKEKQEDKNKETKKQTPRGVIDLDYSYTETKIQSPAPPAAKKAKEPEEPEKTVIDLDEIYSGPMAPTTQQNSVLSKQEPSEEKTPEQEDDLDDFLASFVDDEEGDTETPVVHDSAITDSDKHTETAEENKDNNKEEEKEDENNELENPIDNLIDDVITTQNMSFSEADIDAIQTKLQVDISDDLLKQTNIDSEQNKELSHLTVEEFDKKYPMLSDSEIEKIINNPNIKFNDIDINVIFSPITSYEMSEDAILEAQLRKEKEDEANIQYYENEQDFAFTLIKTQDVQNPDELVVLDNNVYPDLANVDFSNDAIFKEFSFAKPDYPDMPDTESAPTEEDIDNAIAREMEIINKQKEAEQTEKQKQEESNDDILSEFKLIKPDVTVEKADEHFSSTIFTSKDDIEAQFKALGVEFDSDKKEEEIENITDKTSTDEEQPTETNINNQDTSSAGNMSISDDTKIYATYQIDFSTELYIATYNNKISLLGMKNGVIKHLLDFEDGKIPSKLSARKAEQTESGETRYIVRADKEKFVVDVSQNDINLVLVL